MPVAQVTLRRKNSPNNIEAHKEWGRLLRGTFIDVHDGTNFHAGMDLRWKTFDKEHFILFVTDVPETMDGQPWIQFFREWLLAPHEANTNAVLEYSFADGEYIEGETVTADNFTGEVSAVENEQVEGVQVRYSGEPNGLNKVRSIKGRDAKARVKDIILDERDDTIWFVVRRRRGDFIIGETLSIAQGKAEVLQTTSFNRGNMKVVNVVVQGDIDPPEPLIGQTSGTEGVLTEGSARIAPTKRFLPMNKLPPGTVGDFNSSGWSEMDMTEFENCVKRHPDESIPNRNPNSMDDEALDDDVRA